MSTDSTAGGAASGRVTPTRGTTDPAPVDVGMPWPPSPAARSATAPFGFSSASDSRGARSLVEQESAPTPGRLAVVMAALTIGLLLMGTQLWLLTVALEMYLGGHGDEVWLLALVSGAIFVGGVVMVRQLDQQPRLGR